MDWLRAIFGIPPGGNGVTPPGMPTSGIISVDDFDRLVAINEGKSGFGILLQVVRQSGSIQRHEEHRDREKAIKSAQAVFRRKKVELVRVWRNTETYVDIRVPYHQARGGAEGKKVRGIVLQWLPWTTG